MKWLLSMVVAALLVTIAIGITQTLVLMRLTRESAAQQQRVEAMQRDQQATLKTLADEVASANARPVAKDPAPTTPAASPAQAPATAPGAAKHARPPHAHRPKATISH